MSDLNRCWSPMCTQMEFTFDAANKKLFFLIYYYSILNVYWSSVQMKLHKQSKARAMYYCTSGHFLSQVLHFSFDLKKNRRKIIWQYRYLRYIHCTIDILQKKKNEIILDKITFRFNNLNINFTQLNWLLHHVRPYLFHFIQKYFKYSIR